MSFFVQTLESRRLLSAGSLDLTYAGVGYGTDKITASSFVIHDTALQPGDQMLVAGDAGGVPLLARYSAEGYRDTSFAGTTTVTGNPRGIDSVDLIATQADGKILVFDSTTPGGTAAIIRLTYGGKVDSTFGKNGVTRFWFATGTTGRAMTVGADGSIAIVGDDGNNVQVAKLTASGKLDGNFGDGGTFIGNFNLAGTNSENATYTRTAEFIRIDSAGDVFVAGSFNLDELSPPSTFTHPFVAKLTNKGIPDTTFNGTGTLEISNQGNVDLKGFALLSNGQSIISFNGDAFSGMERIKTNGSVDSTFGDSGVASVGGASNGIAAQDDGRIIVAEPTQLARYDSAGVLDSTFTDDNISNAGQIVGLGSDGSLLTLSISHKQASAPTLWTLHPARHWTEQAPAGLLAANDITVAPSATYRFSIQWRAELNVAVKSLSNPHIQIIGPNGKTYKAAFLATTKTGNGSQRTANYKFAAPGGSWDRSDDGIYLIRLIGGIVKDVPGDSATGRILGQFTIAI